MFKLGKKTEYGIMALQYMMNHDAGVATVKEIAEKYNVSQTLLAKILQQLGKNGLVQSVQGKKGGYILSENAAEISLSQIVEAIEGPIRVTDCSGVDDCCDRTPLCTVKKGFDSVHTKLITYLDSITLNDFAVDEMI